jgi:hypothetical protein
MSSFFLKDYEFDFEMNVPEDNGNDFENEDQVRVVNDNMDHDGDVVCPKLYPGSSITSQESTLLLYSLALRDKMSKSTLARVLAVINAHLPKGASIPSSIYQLEKQLEPDFSHVKKTVFCRVCEGQVDDNECIGCHSEMNEKELLKTGKFYLEFDIRQTLRSLLEIPEIGDKLLATMNNRSEDRDSITDIIDGECYKQLGLREHDFTCCVNTDGMSVFASSSLCIWPIFLSVNELPYKDRRKHTTLVALWHGMKKPNFKTYLTPFVEQCNSLSNEGLTWTHRGVEITSKVYFTHVAADSPARCQLQGIKQFNGFYSCTWCYVKGETLHLESGSHKTIFPPEKRYKERTEKSFLSDLNQLYEMFSSGGGDKDYNGVKCASPLIPLAKFNITNGFIVDVMHTALLGVLRSLTLMILDSKNHAEDYYLGPDKQSQIVTRFMNCKVPYEVNRSTRDLKDIPHWKANEWKTWLIVCIPILKGILKDQYLDHLSKFVMAISIMMGDKISLDDLSFADSLLKKFCNDAPILYGLQVCTYNVHLLNHFAQCVRNWGPLWAYSLFQFENANGELTKLFSGTRQICMQIVKKVCILQKVRNTSSSVMCDEEASELQKALADNKKYYKNSVKCDRGVTLVGPRKEYTLNEIESKMLKAENITIEGIETIWSYKHFFVKGRKFAISNSDSERCCNSVVNIVGKLFIISKALLVKYSTNSSTPIIFCNEIIGKHCQTMFKVTGKSRRISIFKCHYIRNVKFITVFDDNGKLTHLCKLLNTAELE